MGSGLHKRLLVAAMSIWAFAFGTIPGAPAAGLAQQPVQQSNQPVSFDLVPSFGTSSYSFALSPDEKFIGVTAGTGADLWDVAKRRRIRHFAGLTSFAQTVSISPDGKWIAAANGEIVAWDIATGQETLRVRPFQGPSDTVESIAFSPDGRRIYFAGSSTVSSVRPGRVNFTYHVGGIVDIASKATKTLVGTTISGDVVFPSSDGKLFAIGQSNATIQIFNSDGELQRVLGANGNKINLVRAIALSPDNKKLAASLNDGQVVEIWDVVGGKRIQSLQFSGENNFTGVAWSPDGQHLAIRTERTLQIWNAASWTLEKKTEFSDGAGYPTVRYSADGRTLFTSEARQLLRVQVDTLAYETINDVQGFASLIDGQSSSGDKALLLHSTKAASCIILAVDIQRATFQEVHRDTSKCGYEFSSNAEGSRFLGIDDDSLFAIDLNADPQRRVLRTNLQKYANASLAPDGKLAILTQPQAGNNFSVDLIDWLSGATAKHLQAHQDAMIAITTAPTSIMSPDGKLLVTTGAIDSVLRQWDPSSGRVLASHKYEAASLTTVPNAIVFAPDSKSFIGLQTSVTKYSFEYWQSGASKPQQTYLLPGGNSILQASAFHPTQKKVVVGGFDALLRVWDLSSGKVAATLKGHNGIPQHAIYKADGRRIVSSGSEDGLKIWDAETGQLLLTIYLTADGDWLKITPEGFFDASTEGAKALTIVRGLESFSIEQFYQSLYRPDLVREKLAGDSRGLVRTAAAELDLGKVLASGDAPEVRLASPATDVLATSATGARISTAVEISDRGGGIGRVEWRVNGVTVGLDQPQTGVAQVSLTHELLLEPGSNLVEVSAYNGANLIASDIARANITVRPSAPPTASQPAPTDQSPSNAQVSAQRPRLFVIAAGVNKYADARFELKNAVSDASDIGSAFRDAGGDLYQSVDVRILSDSDVTRDKLETTFSELATKIAPSDVFVLYLAGHGKTIDGRYYFVPQNFSIDGSLTDTSINAAVKAKAIAQDQWQRWFAKIPARRSVILFDTCDSGTLADDETQQLEKGVANARLVQATGRSILTASGGAEEALEGYHGHGLFTYEVLDAISQADGDHSGTIELNELAAYVYAEVSELSEKIFKQRQTPQMNVTANYPLAKQMHVLTDDATPVASGKPIYQVAQTAQLQIQPGPGATVVRALSAKSRVTVLESRDGWSLVAADGKPIGYVPSGSLKPAQ